jgi:tRNA (guanine37-N1)-methyltransferase
MIFDILTIFPELLNSPLEESILKRARDKGQITVNLTNIRNFAFDRHQTTDDRPFGGGEGMVMKPEPLALAVEKIKEKNPAGKVILLSPQGYRYDHATALRLSEESHLILVCGRYEGVDERFREGYVDEEISLGDFILTGGELAAMVVIDSVTRLLPGVLGCTDSAEKDTFSRSLLKHPQYTRPRVFNDSEVPAELLSGDHELIATYRFLASVKRTLERRPELVTKAEFSSDELKVLRQHGLYDDVTRNQKDIR